MKIARIENLAVVFSRLLIAVARRLPFKLKKFYVPALRQVLNRPGDAASSFGEIYVRQIYDPVAPLPPQPNIVDLGSSVGLFVMFMNQRIHGGRITSFEASPAAFRHLQDNIRRMPSQNRNDVKIKNVAICNYSGEIDFLLDQTNDTNVAATAFRDISKFPDIGNFISVRIPCERLDHFVDTRIDYLKCDIEGAEYQVLEDQILDPMKIGQMAIEFHDIGKHRTEFNRIVETCVDRGYSIRDRNNRKIDSLATLYGTLGNGEQSMVLKFCAKDLRESVTGR
jgi:FkbM family methyltransferase